MRISMSLWEKPTLGNFAACEIDLGNYPMSDMTLKQLQMALESAGKAAEKAIYEYTPK